MGIGGKRKCKTLLFAATPGKATLTAKPNGITHWVVGDTLAMTCEASVGTVDSATQVKAVGVANISNRNGKTFLKRSRSRKGNKQTVSRTM